MEVEHLLEDEILQLLLRQRRHVGHVEHVGGRRLHRLLEPRLVVGLEVRRDVLVVERLRRRQPLRLVEDEQLAQYFNR